MKHVLVLGTQIPFVRGGAELLNENLVTEINKLKGVKAELVQLPFKWYPETQILNDIMSWRFLDLSEVNGSKIDLAIPTKFPTYALQHKNKVVWLVHQHRPFYDLENTEYASAITPEFELTKKKVRELDSKFLTECRDILTISQNVSSRLKKYNALDSTALLPPSPLTGKISPDIYGNKIVYIGRLAPNKRPDLLLKALTFAKGARALLIGPGKDEDVMHLKQIIRENKLEERCELLGFLSEEDLLTHLATARAVFYAPYDEDYGFATIEAFLAKKPVITCHDSGEVNKIVEMTGSGFISVNDPKAIGENIAKVYDMTSSQLERLADSGYTFAKGITWEKVLKKLVMEHL